MEIRGRIHGKKEGTWLSDDGKHHPCFQGLQICPLYIFGNKATGTYGSKCWFPGFGFDSGPNL